MADPGGAALGTAHYSDSSQISLRLLSERVETIDRAFYLRRIAAAEAHRKRVVADSDAYRLVHGEGDGLPGLVIDRYGEYFTLQTLDQGMDRAKAEIVSCLEELFAPKGIAERNDASVRKREALPLQSGVLAGEVPETVAVRMNGLKLHCGFVARAEDRDLSRPARELHRGSPLRPRAGAGLFYIYGVALPCIWRRGAKAWRRWTAQKRASVLPA